MAEGLDQLEITVNLSLSIAVTSQWSKHTAAEINV